MNARYNIKLPHDLHACFTNAQEIASRVGESFTPTKQFDARAVGLAIRSGDRREMLIENGSPRVLTLATIVHELTHIWQYDKRGNNQIEVEVAEGQARYIEIDFLRASGAYALADRLQQQAAEGEDVYACGWRRVMQECHFHHSSVFRCIAKML